MNILTFDIEEWFHILDHDSTKNEKQWNNYEYRLEANMDKIFSLLHNKTKMPHFLFRMGCKKFPHIIKKINSMGYEIGTHSNMHQLAYKQSKDEFATDLKKSIDLLKILLVKKLKYIELRFFYKKTKFMGF